ncbi:MAG: UvrB/UvrC motif-containing protein, partial [Pirellulaceae bacterium]|nr:UvrB/UvrC motif-containing protein [Pirellulaceae bacterium]
NEQTAQCLRFELNTCPGPCAGGCSRESYRQKVEKAVRFLKGKDHAMLDRLEERMRKAAAQLSFERAGVLRDQSRQIKWLSRRIKQMSTATKKLDGIWSLPGFDHQQHWMILRAGQITECTQGPADARSLPACQEAQARPAQVPQTHLNINLMMLLAAWIKKNPQETKAIVKFKEIVGSAATQRSKRSA